MILSQQTPDCSDFDVALAADSSPAFRLLLPEWVHAEGFEYPGLLHVLPGKWRRQGGVTEGRFSVLGQLEVHVVLEPGETTLGIRLEAANTGAGPLSNVWANVCMALNHLPGEPGWSNERFLANLPLDRSLQGRHWYEKLAPRGLQALAARGWLPMHPHPEQPEADGVAPYQWEAGAEADVRACAVESPDAAAWAFQAWAGPCRFCTPFPGNACMHLEPFLAAVVEPGASAVAVGLAGIHSGDRRSLTARIDEFRAGAGSTG